MLRFTFLFACLLGITLGGGGLFPMTEEEIEKCMPLQNGMDIAVEQLNMKNDRKENDYRLVRTETIKASKQVVTGVLYRVHVTMEESVCQNVEGNKYKGLTDCPTKGNGQNKDCVFTIWSRPWMKKFGKDLLIKGINCN
eukprot:TCONS_00004643-protein